MEQRQENQHHDNGSINDGIPHLARCVEDDAQGVFRLTVFAVFAHAAEDVLGQFRDGTLTADQSSVSAVLEAIDVIKILLVALDQLGAEPAGDDSALLKRLRGIAQDEPTAAAPQKQEPLSSRLGGLSSVDCAIEMALAGAKKRPEGIRFAAAPEEVLHAALRDAVWKTCEGDGPKPVDDALRQFELAEASDLDVFLSCLAESLGELGSEPAAISELNALFHDVRKTKPNAAGRAQSPATAD